MSIPLTRDSLIYENLSSGVTVYQGTWHGTVPVAIKDQIHYNVEEANDAVNEVLSQIQLDHPHICKVYECFLECSLTQDWKVKSVLVMELLAQDLKQAIEERKANGRPWSEDELMKHLTALVSALSYAQSKGISHRDIKPHNLFLSLDEQIIKVGGFPCAIRNIEICQAITLAGTPFFMSPELKHRYSQQILRNGVECVPYDPVKSDVYSLGVTLLYMATLEPPTQLTDLSKLENGTQDVLLQVSHFPSLQKYLGWMLNIDPQNRPTFTAIKDRLDFTSISRFPTEATSTDTPESQSKVSVSLNTVEMQIGEGKQKKCAKCRLNVNLPLSETGAFIILHCGHVFHSIDCFIQFLEKNQKALIKKGHFFCPICQDAIRLEDFPVDIEPKVARLFHNPATVCSLCLIEKYEYSYQRCTHRVCIECHRRNPETGHFDCPVCLR